MVALLTLSAGVVLAQSNKKSTEVLYFKANLCKCKAGACNALQADVDSVIVKYFQNENIEFKVIKLADEANKDLVTRIQCKVTDRGDYQQKKEKRKCCRRFCYCCQLFKDKR